MSEKENNDEYWKNELRRLKDELRELKKEVKGRDERDDYEMFPRVRARKRYKKIKKHPSGFAFDFDFDHSFGNYLDSLMGSVAESLDSAFRGVFTTGTRSSRRRKGRFGSVSLTKEQEEKFFEETPELIGLLADGNRLKLLKRLESGPKYQSDLTDDKLQGGKFKHHMDKLLEAGWIIQEKARGRYLITISGREALKFAEFMFTRSNPDLFRHKRAESDDDKVQDSESPSFVKSREDEIDIETDIDIDDNDDDDDDYIQIDDKE
ncbi:MAG: hypothetical protein ACTSP4_12405 [Candidatus Hodarchaeales archaeon]